MGNKQVTPATTFNCPIYAENIETWSTKLEDRRTRAVYSCMYMIGNRTGMGTRTLIKFSERLQRYGAYSSISYVDTHAIRNSSNLVLISCWNSGWTIHGCLRFMLAAIFTWYSSRRTMIYLSTLLKLRVQLRSLVVGYWRNVYFYFEKASEIEKRPQ